MAINEQWMPIILEGVSWIKDRLGPSKQDLKIRISDLEEQVRTLSAGNTALMYSLSLITTAVLDHIKKDHNYEIKADTIVFIGQNMGEVNTKTQKLTDGYIIGDVFEKKVEFDVSKAFDGVDEEIFYAKTKKPSDRR